MGVGNKIFLPEITLIWCRQKCEFRTRRVSLPAWTLCGIIPTRSYGFVTCTLKKFFKIIKMWKNY